MILGTESLHSRAAGSRLQRVEGHWHLLGRCIFEILTIFAVCAGGSGFWDATVAAENRFFKGVYQSARGGHTR